MERMTTENSDKTVLASETGMPEETVAAIVETDSLK